MAGAAGGGHLAFLLFESAKTARHSPHPMKQRRQQDSDREEEEEEEEEEERAAFRAPTRRSLQRMGRGRSERRARRPLGSWSGIGPGCGGCSCSPPSRRPCRSSEGGLEGGVRFVEQCILL